MGGQSHSTELLRLGYTPQDLDFLMGLVGLKYTTEDALVLLDYLRSPPEDKRSTTLTAEDMRRLLPHRDFQVNRRI